MSANSLEHHDAPFRLRCVHSLQVPAQRFLAERIGFRGRLSPENATAQSSPRHSSNQSNQVHVESLKSEFPMELLLQTGIFKNIRGTPQPNPQLLGFGLKRKARKEGEKDDWRYTYPILIPYLNDDGTCFYEAFFALSCLSRRLRPHPSVPPYLGRTDMPLLPYIDRGPSAARWRTALVMPAAAMLPCTTMCYLSNGGRFCSLASGSIIQETQLRSRPLAAVYRRALASQSQPNLANL
jgi:hypothetical protein